MPSISHHQQLPKHNLGTLNQAGPVQNTWYTILSTTKDLCIVGLVVSVQTTNETLEVEIVIDGNTYTNTNASVAGTNYTVYMSLSDTTMSPVFDTGTYNTSLRYGKFCGHSIQIRIRKTTAAGAGNIRAAVLYETMR